MRVLVTRPRHRAAVLARDLDAAGVEAIIEPLLDIVPRAGVALDLSDVQALLVTSANAALPLAAATGRRDLPVFAVGDATAAAVSDAGFGDVTSAGGAAGDLARLVGARLDPAAGALIHVAGAKVAGDLTGPLEAAGFAARRVVLYDAQPVEALSPATVEVIAADRLDGVVFFSPRTAALFVTLARQAGIARHARRLGAFCLSVAVAKAAEGLDWREVTISERPESVALVALVAAAGRRE
jgi:uroporphyrinogen-III synthase